MVKKRRKSTSYRARSKPRVASPPGWVVTAVTVCLDPTCGCFDGPVRPSPALLARRASPAAAAPASKIAPKQETGTPVRVPVSTDVDWLGVERGRALECA
jgi:hypothetical protein